MTYQQETPQEPDFARLRANMVNGQLLTNGLYAPALIETYRETPREKFVDAALAGRAYLDEDVRIAGTDRFLLEPLVESRLLQHALAGESCRTALALGAASLPSLEMLASFVGHLAIIEPDRGLASAAALRLARPNVQVIEADYRTPQGAAAPYDVIFITGAVATIPAFLKDQLAEGGRIVAVTRPSPRATGRIAVVSRTGADAFDTLVFEDASTPYLQGFEPATRFYF